MSEDQEQSKPDLRASIGPLREQNQILVAMLREFVSHVADSELRLRMSAAVEQGAKNVLKVEDLPEIKRLRTEVATLRAQVDDRPLTLRQKASTVFTILALAGSFVLAYCVL